MKGKLNAYATTMAGRPIMRSTTTTHYTHKREEEKKNNTTTKLCTNNTGFNLWQWFKR